MDNIYKNNKFAYYNRNQAIEDGVLIEVSNTAKLANIKWQVAVTKSVWLEYIEWTEDDNRKQVYQNTETRLKDIVYALSLAMKETKSETDIIDFEISIIPKDGLSHLAYPTKLKALVTRDEYLEPLITIMLADKD